MNIREDSTIRAPSPSGKDDICAKFTIDTVNEPFVLHDIAQAGQEYTLSFWAYSETDGEITAGNVDMPTSSSWTRYVVFTGNNLYENVGGIYADYGAKNVVFSNNLIQGSTEAGLHFGNEDYTVNGTTASIPCENFAIVGNAFIENAVAIKKTTAPLTSKIENNIMLGNTTDEQ